jgi:hypothetical protein
MDLMPDPPNQTANKQSTEALIDELAACGILEGGVPRAEGFGMYDELISFLNARTHEGGLGPFLCELYNCGDRFKYRTIKRGEQRLKNVWFSFCGATTVEGVQEAFSQGMIDGGLAARMLFIYSDKRGRAVAIPPNQEQTIQDLAHRLQGIRDTIHGQVEWANDSSMYWFKNDYDSAYESHPLLKVPSARGYMQRRGDTMLKLAVILAIDDSGELKVRQCDLERAKDILETDIEAFLPSVFEEIGANPQGVKLAKVERLIRDHGEIDRSSLLRRISRTINAEELSRIVNTLNSSGMVTTVSSRAGRGIKYKWLGGSNE